MIGLDCGLVLVTDFLSTSTEDVDMGRGLTSRFVSLFTGTTDVRRWSVDDVVDLVRFSESLGLSETRLGVALDNDVKELDRWIEARPRPLMLECLRIRLPLASSLLLSPL